MFKIWPWLEANRKGLIVAVVAVGVFIGGVSFWSSHQEQRERQAGEALTRTLSNPPVSPETLMGFASSETGTQAGDRAQLQAGLGYFENKDYANAQRVLETFAQAHANTALANQAIFGVGACLEAQGKLDLAAEAYGRVAASPVNDGSAVMANFALGRVAQQQGKLKEASDDFQKVLRNVNQQLSIYNDAVRHLQAIQQQQGLAAPLAK